jgi:hypothetical protein
MTTLNDGCFASCIDVPNEAKCDVLYGGQQASASASAWGALYDLNR